MSAIPTKNGLYRALDVNGDGSGSFNQNVDGIATPTEFYIKPPAGTTYVLRRLNGLVIALNFNDATKYGTLTLVNGIEIFIENKDGNRILDFTEQVKIKRSYDYALLAGVDITTAGGAGNDPLTFRWTFARGPGDLVLNGDLEERFVVKVSDKLDVSIADQIMMIQGFKRDNKSESQLGNQ